MIHYYAWGESVEKVKTMFIWFMIFFYIVMPSSWHLTVFAGDDASVINIKIMQTTDMHGNILDYKYQSAEKTVDFGLVRTASLIKKIREEYENTLLFDTGDILEGNALGEYAYRSRFFNLGRVHPVIKAMNYLNYDGATVGNHEFNYGLNFLMQSLQGAAFPFVNANIYIDDHNTNPIDDINLLPPYIIQDKEWTDESGVKQKLKIGIIGFVTPIVAEWDKEYFRDKLIVKNISETARHYVPLMKEEGADIIVALAHVGMDADKGLQEKEGNSVSDLSQVSGIDAILYGHTHSVYPSRPGLNLVNTSRPAIVQAGYWGNHLGIIDLKLVNKNGKWKVEKSTSSIQTIYRTIKNKKIPVTGRDTELEKLMMKDHLNVKKFSEIK